MIDKKDLDGLMQNCSNSIAYALELLQSCSKPSMYFLMGKQTHHANVEM